MRTIRFLLQKEFRQIFRNKSILAMVMVMPIVQLLILPLAADYEIKNINLAVVDEDRSPYSQKLISKITSSGYFRLTGFENNYNEAFRLIEQEKADIVLQIPPHFESTLVRENKSALFVAVNAINGTKASLGGSYLSAIIRNFNGEIRVQLMQPGRFSRVEQVETPTRFWFNPFLNYHMYMVPGILAILVTMIGGFLSALNIVKEKEVGTIEQINVTPIHKHHFILGKLIPFWVLGNIVFIIGLGVSWLVYGIVPQGNIALLFAFVAVYLLAVLGLGLLVSTLCETQQQAMFIMFFFMMVFILMGGLFTSVDSMPDWARVIVRFNPVSYLIDVMRMVILKGSNFGDVRQKMIIIAGFAIVLNTLAILNYRKRA
ncbi:ABC transporter permease [Flavihumibacter solisilvae]|uniref:ABC transporter permease n=1 Tax=Flavihumibacter solisilvae TaxID=1349421 RepID=A0A0C1LJY2_9BACT|nr:ABC transporter permease [Flavihumibacter solisilvae]KIC95693.1 ABC transporter permease [Flavihumibacter solisilvae]